MNADICSKCLVTDPWVKSFICSRIAYLLPAIQVVRIIANHSRQPQLGLRPKDGRNYSVKNLCVLRARSDHRSRLAHHRRHAVAQPGIAVVSCAVVAAPAAPAALHLASSSIQMSEIMVPDRSHRWRPISACSQDLLPLTRLPHGSHAAAASSRDKRNPHRRSRE